MVIDEGLKKSIMEILKYHQIDDREWMRELYLQGYTLSSAVGRFY